MTLLALRIMKHALLIVVCAVAFAQPTQVAVFNNFSQTIKGMTIGQARCILWAKAPPWGPEVACWTGTIVQHIQVAMPLSPGGSMQGYFKSSEGSVTWLVTDVGKWQLTAEPTGGIALFKEGVF